MNNFIDKDAELARLDKEIHRAQNVVSKWKPS
jgi:hypothetical protein